MKKVWNSIILKKIALFISITIMLATIYYKIIPIINAYGTEAFKEKDFTKTEKFQRFFENQIISLENDISKETNENGINYSTFNFLNRVESNTEYILDIEKIDGKTMLLSNITTDESQIKTIMKNFENSKRYYICKLNEMPKTNQKNLIYYQFHADQSKFKKLDVYMRIDNFEKNDYIKSFKDNYEDFSNNIKERFTIIIISGTIALILLISLTKQTKKANYFDKLYIEQAILILAYIILFLIRLINSQSYLVNLPNEAKWIICAILYVIASEIYFAIARKVKLKKIQNAFLIPKILANLNKIYSSFICYILFCICTLYAVMDVSPIYTGLYYKNEIAIGMLIAYTIVLLHNLQQRIELIEITKKVKKIAIGEKFEKLQAKNNMYQELTENINCIQEGMKKSMQQQLKAEKLKTDLITNVSHDLKTPLTSIINYADLLKKEKIENKNAQKYIKILEEKSKKLKNLTEDLIEASRISSGNEQINLQPLNFTEIILQANGEFAERFEQKKLDLISNLPKEEIQLKLDGKKMWRVLENLYQNAMKYSLENTRIYVDLKRKEEEIEFSIKNISKESLNISPDELMERFVRGDKSRNTTGSGLGLSISKDLVALQGGKLKIEIQGDLFTAIITFGHEGDRS